MTSFLEPGSVLQDRYEIRGEIGRGGFSVVYDALDRNVGNGVAVKLLVPPPAVAEKARERMRREVLAVRSLNHPNIVTIYDFLEEGPWSFVVMEKVAGGDLHALVSRRGPLRADFVRQLGAEVASALVAAHRGGILHRDVKPQNVLIHDGDDGERALLSDFGSAKIEGESTLTATGQQVGTLDTMAPEVLRGARADARADVYSLGITLYYALTGDYPPSPSRHMPPTPRPEGHHPSERRADVPPELDAAVAQATREEPGERFPTAGVLADALTGRIALAPVAARTPMLDLCLLCGGPDPLSLGVCAGCRGRDPRRERDEKLLVVEPGLEWEARRALCERLASLPSEPSSSAIEATARGERALLAVSGANAARLADKLCAREIPVQVVSPGGALRALPGPFRALMLANLGVGLALGFALQALYFWIAALGVLGLTGVARRAVCRPLIRPRAARSTLPAPIEERVVAALGELAPGSARNLLADVARTGQDLFGLESVAENAAVGARVGALVTTASDAARELGAIDSALDRLEKQRASEPSASKAWAEGLARSERARDTLVQRLLEALAALATLRSDAVRGSLGVVDQLEELTDELRREREIQAEAAREVEEFLERGV